MRFYRTVVAAAVVMVNVGALASNVTAQAPDPLIGTWHMDVAQSKFSPGPPLKSAQLKFEPAGRGMKSTSDIVAPDGQVRHQEFTALNDGKDYPITDSAIADTVSLQGSGNARVRTDKKGGKVVMTYNGTISSDGRTFTVQQKGTGPKGEAVNNTLVFRKQ